MKVKDLIEKLKAFNPDMEVMINATKPDMDMFKFENIVMVDAIGLHTETEEIVCISHTNIDEFSSEEEN